MAISVSTRKTSTFKRPVTVRVPEGEGFRTGTFVAEFSLIEREKIAGQTDTDLLEEVLVAVYDVNDENGNPHPQDVARAWAINDLCASGALVAAFLEAVDQKKKTSRR